MNEPLDKLSSFLVNTVIEVLIIYRSELLKNDLYGYDKYLDIGHKLENLIEQINFIVEDIEEITT